MTHWRFAIQLILAVALIATPLQVAAPGTSAAPGDGGPLLYGVNPFDNDADYGDRGFQPIGGSGRFADGGRVITLSGETVQSAQAIAVHPITGVVYMSVTLSDTTSRLLVSFNPATGAATTIGTPIAQINGTPTTLQIAGLAFDAAGTLYGVTGDAGGGNAPGPAASCRSCLVTINVANAAAQLKKRLGTEIKGPIPGPATPDATGEAIAIDPDSGLIYHASGWNNDRVFETIDPASVFAQAPIALTGAVPEVIYGFGYDPVTDTIYAQDWNRDLYTITPAGVGTLVHTMWSYYRGFAVVPNPAPVAVDDLATFAQNQGVTFIDVLENDIDGSVTPVGTVQAVTQPPNGIAEVQPGGIGVRYQPLPNECHNSGQTNTDNFTYTLDTGSTATVLISIPCPVYGGTVTLRYSARRHTFKGTLSYPTFPACSANAPIDIYNVKLGTLVGSVITDADGNFKLKKRVRRGTYYADVDFHEVPQAARCLGPDSPELKVK